MTSLLRQTAIILVWTRITLLYWIFAGIWASRFRPRDGGNDEERYFRMAYAPKYACNSRHKIVFEDPGLEQIVIFFSLKFYSSPAIVFYTCLVIPNIPCVQFSAMQNKKESICCKCTTKTYSEEWSFYQKYFNKNEKWRSLGIFHLPISNADNSIWKPPNQGPTLLQNTA